jgi:hypothetical protein
VQLSPAFTMEAVLDTRLVGYWSDKNLYQGTMEAADIAFRPDGTGWAYWSRIGGGFFVLRFSWDTPKDWQLVLGLREELSGRWRAERHTVRHRVTSQIACDTKIVLTYKIRAGQDVLGRPATLLEAGQPISRGTIGDRFALERELAGDEQDPAARRRTGNVVQRRSAPAVNHDERSGSGRPRQSGWKP